MIQIKIFIAKMKFYFGILAKKIKHLYTEEKFKFWAIIGAVALICIIAYGTKWWNARKTENESAGIVSTTVEQTETPHKEYEVFQGLKCYEKGCEEYASEGSYYCDDHRCQWEKGCLKRRDSGNYCWDHVCSNPTCQSPILAEGYDYCVKHYLELYPDADINAILNPAAQSLVTVSQNAVDIPNADEMIENQEAISDDETTVDDNSDADEDEDAVETNKTTDDDDEDNQTSEKSSDKNADKNADKNTDKNTGKNKKNSR